VPAGQVVASQGSIPKLADYLSTSGLEGAWARLYTRDDPSAGLSSVVYRFGAPEGAAGLVAATAALTTPDYASAITVERVQADAIGDTSQLMRYRIPGARTLEYTWAQGRLAGQVILRYSGDIEGPDDIGLLIALARAQSEKMAADR
jgi:hypothetical protein